MPLGINAKCKARLKELVAKSLAQVKVDKDVFLNFPSTVELLIADQALPKTGKLSERLQKYLAEAPFFQFVFETVSRELSENNTYNSENAGIPLDAFPGYADLAVVAERLVDEFETLPWRYLISFEFPDSVGAPIRDAAPAYDLGSSVRIVNPDDQYDSTYPLKSGIEKRDDELFGGRAHIFARKLPEEWNKEASYIQIDTEGFIGRYVDGTPAEDAVGILKSFVGLSLATRLMKVNEGAGGLAFGALGFAPPKRRLIIHRKIDKAWQIWSTPELPSDLSVALGKLQIDDVDGQIKPDRLKGWVQHRFAVISTAFQNSDKAERVLLAAQWLLDSYVGANQLLSFVQTTVAMEILLGEGSKSDVIGIGELLRNRCAYLIGKSRGQREELLKDFEKIYDVRSKIVHRGKSRLTFEERSLFNKLQWMCRRVISEELGLIAKDKESAT